MNWYGKLLGIDVEEDVRRGEEADARLNELNRRALESGKYDAATYAVAQANLERSRISLEDAREQIDDAYVEGLKEGQENVSKVIKGTLNTVVAAPLKAVLGGVPWWLWVAGVGGAFFYFGGGSMLKGALKR